MDAHDYVYENTPSPLRRKTGSYLPGPILTNRPTEPTFNSTLIFIIGFQKVFRQFFLLRQLFYIEEAIVVSMAPPSIYLDWLWLLSSWRQLYLLKFEYAAGWSQWLLTNLIAWFTFLIDHQTLFRRSDGKRLMKMILSKLRVSPPLVYDQPR